MELEQGTILAVCSGFAGLVACIYYLQSIAKNFKHDKEAFRAEILQSAKESITASADNLNSQRQILYTELENNTKTVAADLDNFKKTVDKDLGHIRETYNGEIRNLGHKIEDLRAELRNQHGQLVNLLSEMIKKSD